MENQENQIPENENNIPEIENPAVQSADAVPVIEPAEAVTEPVTAEEEPAAEEKPKKVEKKAYGGNKVWTGILCAVLAVALIAGSCLLTAASLNDRWEDRMKEQKAEFQKLLESANTDRKPLTDSDHNNSGTPVQSVSGTKTPAQVYADNVDTVVMVYCEYNRQQGGQSMTATSTGSGFIVTNDGYVVTNAHVVDGATNIFVTIYDNTEYRARLVGADTVNDVALLKIDASDLDYAVIGRSDDLIVGDQVVAIGNPLGELTSTLTVGYISAMERDVNTDGTTINMLQTDAAINSGNSGGPLFNMNGEVVGITTAKYSGTTESGAVIEGIGFAIPIDDVYDLISDLKDYGYVTGAYLGVSVTDMDPEAAAYYGMPVGARVEEAVEGYSAARAGVLAKDIIVALGDNEVGNVSELTRALRKFAAGDTTTITVFRGGRELVLDITLDEKPDSNQGTMPEGDFDEWFDYLKPYFEND